MVGHQQARAESRMHACVPQMQLSRVSILWPRRRLVLTPEGERRGGGEGARRGGRLAVVLWSHNTTSVCLSTQHKYTNIQTDRPNARELTCTVNAKTPRQGHSYAFQKGETLLASKRLDHHQIGASTPRPLRLPPPALACLVTALAAPLAFIIKFPRPVVSPSFLSIHTQTQRVESST